MKAALSRKLAGRYKRRTRALREGSHTLRSFPDAHAVQIAPYAEVLCEHGSGALNCVDCQI